MSYRQGVIAFFFGLVGLTVVLAIGDTLRLRQCAGIIVLEEEDMMETAAPTLEETDR